MVELDIIFSKRCKQQIRKIVSNLSLYSQMGDDLTNYGHNVIEHLLMISERMPEGKPSLMGLPYVCFSAISDKLETLDPLAGLWGTNYLVIHLLDKIEDQELDSSLLSSTGNGPLINLSIAIIVACLNLMDDQKIFPDENKRHVVRSKIMATLVQMASGQHLDLLNCVTDIDKCWNIIKDKSGSFFALGCYIGAVMATDDQETIQEFQRYGFHVGILIQLANDIAGLWRKKDFCDISMGKNTLPILFARQFYTERNIYTFDQILQQAKVSLEAEKLARKMIFESGAVIYMLVEVEKHKRYAISAIENIHLELRNMDLLSQYVNKIFSPYEIDLSAIHG